jgi:hypothetical protein
MSSTVVLDECLPRPLRKYLPGYEVVTVAGLGLAGYENGQLLKALAGRCMAFITVDSNLSFQQNLPVLPFASIILKVRSNKLEHVVPLAPAILEALAIVQPGSIHHLPPQ